MIFALFVIIMYVQLPYLHSSSYFPELVSIHSDIVGVALEDWLGGDALWIRRKVIIRSMYLFELIHFKQFNKLNEPHARPSKRPKHERFPHSSRHRRISFGQTSSSAKRNSSIGRMTPSVAAKWRLYLSTIPKTIYIHHHFMMFHKMR